MGQQDSCKLDLVVDRYDLDDSVLNYESIDDRLLARWKGIDGSEPDGYRTLTKWLNKILLRTVYDEQGRDTTGVRVDSDYEALTGDDDLLRQEVMDDLAADGIDADRLLCDMVSWSTMRSHLNECLDSEKDVEQSETDWERNSIAIATDIAEDKAEKAVNSLVSKGDLETTSSIDVKVQVLVSCRECPTRLPFRAAAERGFICKDHN